jgi:ubiquinone biosynthesis protein
VLDPDLIPTPLVPSADRPSIVVVPPVPPSRFRGLAVIVRLARWLIGAAWMHARRRWDPEANARGVRIMLEELSGIWIKVGQLLSLRIDLFSIELCRELSRLQDSAAGFPADLARATIERDLGCPVDQVFDVFDDRPIAAASIGQVHRARLRREGVWVAVKVRRPFIAATFAQEVRLVRRWVRVLDLLHVLPFMQWRQLQWELERILNEELDYRVEGSAIERMGRTLTRHDMYVPRLYGAYTTERVLVMEMITGVLMSDYISMIHADPERVREWEHQNDIDPPRVVRRFSHSILRQILEDNLYHGDLHPGNIVLLRHSRVALLDFGTVGFTERAYLEKFALFMSSLARDEFDKAAEVALMMAGALPAIDPAPIKAEVVRELRAWRARAGVRTLPYPLKSVDSVNVAITKVFFRHRITFEWAFLRIRRALATMDAAAMHLHPGANYARISAAYFRRAAARRLAHRAMGRTISGRTARLPDIVSLPEKLVESADLMVEIQRRQLRALGRATGWASMLIRAASRGAAAILALTCVIAVLAIATRGMPVAEAVRLPRLDGQVWLAIIAITSYGVSRAGRVARACAAPDRSGRPRSAAFLGIDGTPVVARKRFTV